jgi:hypothetical protein
MPPGPFDLIFCRNLAFTYFAEDVQLRIAEGLRTRLVTGGLLVLASTSLLLASFAWCRASSVPINHGADWLFLRHTWPAASESTWIGLISGPIAAAILWWWFCDQTRNLAALNPYPCRQLVARPLGCQRSLPPEFWRLNP